MYGDAHGVGYVLHLRFTGYKMSRSLRKEIEDFIFNFPGKVRKRQMREETSWRASTPRFALTHSVKENKIRTASR